MKVARSGLYALDEMTEVDQPFGKHVDDLAFALHVSLGLQKRRMSGGGAVAVVDVGPED